MKNDLSMHIFNYMNKYVNRLICESQSTNNQFRLPIILDIKFLLAIQYYISVKSLLPLLWLWEVFSFKGELFLGDFKLQVALGVMLLERSLNFKQVDDCFLEANLGENVHYRRSLLVTSSLNYNSFLFFSLSQTSFLRTTSPVTVYL